MINNYVDLDATSGTLDYTGASGSGAKTHNGHNGIDLDVPNFRWMGAGVDRPHRSSIGGNVWLTRDVPPGSRVTQAEVLDERHTEGSGM